MPSDGSTYFHVAISEDIKKNDFIEVIYLKKNLVIYMSLKHI